MKINIKPISVNQVWQGRRFKTMTYKVYEDEVLWTLPNSYNIPQKGYIKLWVVFGVSSVLSDVDNLLKPFIDILQKKYGFNDRRIKRIIADKQDVDKGKEFIAFQIKSIDENFKSQK